MSDVDVLYLVGTGRSGSTLLANLLGSTDGMFSAGELRFLWERGYGEDRRCGCGRPFSQCPTWQAIVRRAFPDRAPDLGRMRSEAARVTRVRQLPKVFMSRLDGEDLAQLAPYYLEQVERVYRAVAAETGRMIVDSSKLPTYCHVLHQVPSLRLRVVHLVRDPRATAYSWQRLHASGAVEDDDEEIDRFSPWKASALWAIWNTTASRIFSKRSDYLRVRYEDLMAEPRMVIDDIRAFAGLPPDDSPFVDDRTVRLVPNHAVAGNPNRRRNGDVRLVGDDEWRTALNRADRAVVTAVTASALGHFGYRLSTRSPSVP